MKKLIIMLFFFSLPSFVHAKTLIEVIQHTLATNPDVLVTLNNRHAADQQLKQAQAGYWPVLELTGGYGRETSDNTTTRLNNGEDLTLTRQEIGLSLSQLLFDGFFTKHEIARQHFHNNSSAYKVKEVFENIAFLTAEVYLEILRRQKLVELSKDNVVIHQKTLEKIRLLVEGGVGRQADIQQSKSRLALAKSSLVNAQGNFRNAEINYRRVIGALPDALTIPARVPLDVALPTNTEAALDIALQNHPALQIVQTDLEAARSAHQQSNAYFMPRLSLEVGMTKNKNLEGIEGENDDITAMLRMRYNLFRGGADQARRQETAAQVGAAQETNRSTQRLIEEDVLLSWNSLQTIRARLDHLKAHLDSTEAVLKSYKEQFKLGQRSLLDVLDSENELFNARASLVTAEYGEILSIFKVLESMGILLDTLGIKRPQEAQADGSPR
jgi:adhesin transport system outer membrane protein